MNYIVSENMDLIYYPKLAELSDEILKLESVNSDYLVKVWKGTLSSYRDKFRFAVVISPLSNLGHLYYLWWVKKKDLLNIDEKVKQDTYSDSDFQDAILANLSKLSCNTCSWDGIGFIFTPSEQYFGFSVLEDKKLKLLDGISKKCPNCGKSLRHIVLEIL